MDNNDQPLHEQLVSQLRERIRTSMAPHSQIPAERDLAQEYGVSRNTVRAALAKLEMMGLIYRRRGRGTFVANPLADPTDLSTTYSFTDQMIEQGRDPYSKVIYLQSFPATKYISEQLSIPVGTPTYKLKRLRCADGVPLMVERTFLPADRFPKLDAQSIEKNGLYASMLQGFDAPIVDAKEAFYASLMPDKDAELLQVPLGSPSLNVQRTSTGLNHEIVEFTLSVTRADQFVYRVQHHVHNGNTTT
ncbi:GntR family transcriptional regulator [Lacticaseibacillus pabuli]|uniref:GntR family transcriptional regulator n=1 Tax=Lacticaseibacillus pabuli TaxID=3025672 RepID=A0ABY7WRX7_9LACO|nr:GntR family transcriptional regulator [Lacticaseibacillus sp. KACC 23028]WDF82549.1 GntR family transcriptional regulator [Lacticaseibacillus sp. KACC 23028]